MKIKAALFSVMISLGLTVSPALSATSTDTEKGVKGVLKTDPAKKMIDLFLSEFPGGREITEANVKATVTYPDGKRVEKDLMGMKMGEVYSPLSGLLEARQI